MICPAPEVTVGGKRQSLWNDNLKFESGAGFSLADRRKPVPPEPNAELPPVSWIPFTRRRGKRVAPASCRLSRGRLGLGAAGEDARRTAAETAALLSAMRDGIECQTAWLHAKLGA